MRQRSVRNSWSPVSEQGRIFDMSGKQLAIIGKDFASIDPNRNSWLVRGTEWATKGEANTLVTVDVRDPKLTSTYDLSELLAQPRPPKDRLRRASRSRRVGRALNDR